MPTNEYDDGKIKSKKLFSYPVGKKKMSINEYEDGKKEDQKLFSSLWALGKKQKKPTNE